MIRRQVRFDRNARRRGVGLQDFADGPWRLRRSRRGRRLRGEEFARRGREMGLRRLLEMLAGRRIR
jgi:hypothetical protein